MKVLCFIDSLGSGGAQRQLCALAAGLKKRGHQVRFLVYHRSDHFLPLLLAADIPCQVIPPCPYPQKALAVRRVLRSGWQDVALAFLDAPCLYAELAAIPGRRWGLVVGERNADPRMRKGLGPWLRQFHRLADAVVCNSHTNRLMLRTAFPFLKMKLCTVYNVVDINLFRPSSDESEAAAGGSAGPLRIVVAASYQDKKNMMNLAKALLLLKEKRHSPPVVVDWFGDVPADTAPFDQVERFVSGNGLGASLRLHRATRDIAGEFAGADAIGLFSYYEGLPNAVCEGLACGKPILLSNVCDAGNLVKEGKNGFLCDPGSPESIANAIQLFAGMSGQERARMGAESRRIAESLFGEEAALDRYEKILEAAMLHKPVPAVCDWPAEAPASAQKTAERFGP